MSVTVVIVGFRAYEELERCLASLARHESGARVMVVDNDADEAAGRRIVAAFPSITYFGRRENPGFGAAVNRAAREAPASHLLLLNPDCEVDGPIVAPLLSVLEAHPEAGIVGGLVRDALGGVQASARRFPNLTTAIAGRTSWLSRVAPGNPLSRWNLTTVPSAGVVRVDWVSGAFQLIRRESFDAAGGFDEGFFLYWEDADLCRRVAAAGWHTLYAPVAAVVHYTARASLHTPVRSLWAFHRGALRYYWKHGSWVARMGTPVVAAGLAGRFLVRVVPWARRARHAQ
ncbi:MAG: glycosyltransferase family 2 protein [Acidobacteria bacterium]|nr:glycosyltransferase family 2 protein [Acidobacteriota bacterium]